jgi:hypothetical protein
MEYSLSIPATTTLRERNIRADWCTATFSAQARQCTADLARITLLLLASGCSLVQAADKNYLHFTFKAFVDAHDRSAAEWAWVTLVEIPRDKAYPEEARVIRSAGGELKGHVFGLVRASAWRSRHRYTLKTRCHDKPADHEIFWNESWSEQVFAGGQYNRPYIRRLPNGTEYAVGNEIRFGFTTRPVLLENATWFDPKGASHVFVGPIGAGGAPAEEVRGHFGVKSANYEDPLEHHRRCGDAWVEQYRTAFEHFEHQNLLEQIPDGENESFGQLGYGPHDEKTIVYQIISSHSREHPHWKRQEM